MTDAAPDKTKPAISPVWYVIGFLLLYVGSYPFVQAYAIRFTLHTGVAGAEAVWGVLDVVYWPMDRFFEVVGLGEPVTELLYWLAEKLP